MKDHEGEVIGVLQLINAQAPGTQKVVSFSSSDQSLVESLAIMNKLRTEGHIDPDLFDIFLKKGVYRRYAEQYLDPWQIDEVNL